MKPATNQMHPNMVSTTPRFIQSLWFEAIHPLNAEHLAQTVFIHRFVPSSLSRCRQIDCTQRLILLPNLHNALISNPSGAHWVFAPEHEYHLSAFDMLKSITSTGLFRGDSYIFHCIQLVILVPNVWCTKNNTIRTDIDRYCSRIIDKSNRLKYSRGNYDSVR